MLLELSTVEPRRNLYALVHVRRGGLWSGDGSCTNTVQAAYAGPAVPAGLEKGFVVKMPTLYDGESGELSARMRPATEPPDYVTARGTRGHYLIQPQQTSQRFSLYRWEMSAASGGPGPHFHRTYDETFYVLSGSIRMYDGARWFDAKPGDSLYVPAGGIHAFTNNSGAAASMLMLMTPGADRGAYFDELDQIAASGRPLTEAEWAEVFRRHDNVMLEPME